MLQPSLSKRGGAQATALCLFRLRSFALKFSQARQSARNARRYTVHSYQIGDKVFLGRKFFITAASEAQLSRKLGVKKYGPFKIVELIGQNAVKLELRQDVRIHPVVHVEHIAPAWRQPD